MVDPSLPPVPGQSLDQLVTGFLAAEEVEAVMEKCKKAFIERAMGTGMTHHLGFIATYARGMTVRELRKR